MTVEISKNDEAAAFFAMGVSYVRLAKNYLGYLQQQGGFGQTRANGPLEFDTAAEVAAPSLFCTLHGVELVLKAWHLHVDRHVEPTHKISELITAFRDNCKEPSWCDFHIALMQLERAIKELSGPLSGKSAELLKVPGEPKPWSLLIIDAWYPTLRYPTFKSGQARKYNNHVPLTDVFAFSYVPERQWIQFDIAVGALWKTLTGLCNDIASGN